MAADVPDLQGHEDRAIPVSQPTKLILAINQKIAKTLGLETPAELLARADEVVD
jgi:putative ABC transport system substrate-binding protein